MLDVRFRKRAERDLLAITAWYDDVAPDALERVLADIFRSIEHIREYPASAEQIEGRPYRRIVTRKFQFKVAYIVKTGWIDILGIYRYQNRKI